MTTKNLELYFAISQRMFELARMMALYYMKLANWVTFYSKSILEILAFYLMPVIWYAKTHAHTKGSQKKYNNEIQVK